MSKLMTIWTPSIFRNIIGELDRKTGLRGADYKIKTGKAAHTLGRCNYDEKSFYFSLKFFSDPNFLDAAAIDVIRHEYAHYYAHTADIAKYIHHNRRDVAHGPDWKYACRMVGARPVRCYEPGAFRSKKLSDQQIYDMYMAEDVVEFNILDYIEAMGTVPPLKMFKGRK